MSASTITPKQQSFVRSLAEECLPTLSSQYGVTFSTVDEWLTLADVSTLTGQGASKLIDVLKQLPKVRKTEWSHLPDGRTIVNKFAKACTVCAGVVDTGKGWAVQTDKGWGTYHALGDCGQSSPASDLIEVESKRAYRCEDGTIAIAYTTQNKRIAVRRLVVHEDGTGSLEYWKGGVSIVRATGSLLTQEQASELGKVYGFCICCGKDLSEDTSLAVGYGATCASNNDWWYPTAKEAREILNRPTEVK
jgi:hypothetical protein